MPSTALFKYAQEMEKQLSRQVRQEGLSGELGWCLVRYYREGIDAIYTDAEGYEPANEVEQAQARERLNMLYGRFEADLKRLAAASATESSVPASDDESVLDDVASVYYDEESSPEPEELPRTPSRSPLLLDGESGHVPSMIMSDDVSFLTIATPIPERPGNLTPNATGEDKIPFTPLTPLPKHSFPGTYDPHPYSELALSRGVPYQAQFINLNKVEVSTLIGRGRKPLPASPKTPTDGESETESKKKIKKKRSFWKRISSSSSGSSSSNGEKDYRIANGRMASGKKVKEELKPPTFWCPM